MFLHAAESVPPAQGPLRLAARSVVAGAAKIGRLSGVGNAGVEPWFASVGQSVTLAGGPYSLGNNAVRHVHLGAPPEF